MSDPANSDPANSHYEPARAKLLAAEVALMRQREQVAALRRALPPGPVVTDYVFESNDGPVTIDELASAPGRSLIVYHFMFGGRQDQPCPMCSMWADGWNAIAHHLNETVDLVLVTQGSVAENSELAAARGWTNLRWLSAANSTFKADFGSLDSDGNQSPFMTVFDRDGDDLRLSWSGGARMTGDDWRGIDLLSPAWHMLDLTRAGRGEWMPE